MKKENLINNLNTFFKDSDNMFLFFYFVFLFSTLILCLIMIVINIYDLERYQIILVIIV